MNSEKAIGIIKNCCGDCEECLTNWKDCPKTHRKEIIQAIETAWKEIAKEILQGLNYEIERELSGLNDREFNYGIKIALGKIDCFADKYGVKLDE